MTRPISFSVDRPAQQSRLHVLIRLLLLIAIASVGFSALYWLLYLALPAVVALLVSQKGGQRYLAEDAPKITRALRWLAAAYAYLWLLTDEIPSSSGPVHLEIEPSGAPSPGSAVGRVLMSLPALLLLFLLSVAGGVFWAIAAVFLLVQLEVPASLASFLELTLRYQFRMLGYHLSLTEAYPSLEAEHHAPLGQPG